MARPIENLENAFNEMFDFITDLPSGLDGFESDFDSAFKELTELKSTDAVPVVRCDGCCHRYENEEGVYVCGMSDIPCGMMISAVMENERTLNKE